MTISSPDKPWRNPEIAEGREAALAVLKPTAAQIEHGMALHASAIVVDSYGFAAVAAPDSLRMLAALEQNIEPISYRRLEVDSRMTRMADDALQGELYTEAWEASGVTAVMRNSGEEGNRLEHLIERLAHNTYVNDRMPEVMKRMTTAADIRAAKAEQRHGFIFTTNGVPLPQAGESVIDELRQIRIFRQLGVRMMHLTYNRRNPIGDGCGEASDGGLSDLGRAVVAEMNRLGVIVDIAHSGPRTGLDAANHSERPMVISHAVCASLHEHCRAKSDELMKAVANTGGLMGVCGIPAFLGGTGDIAALLDHIDHAVKTVGIDHVAIGTDIATMLPPTGDLPPVPSAPPVAERLEAIWPENFPMDDPQWDDPRMALTVAWTNWPLFTVGLVQRGYSDSQILKLLGGNMLRVLEANQT